MADNDPRTYKLIELVGTSPVSYAEATKNAVARAGETLRGLGWFQVTELRGLLEEGTISEYQVTLKVASACWTTTRGKTRSTQPSAHRIATLCRRRRGATTPEDLAARVGTRSRDNTSQPPRPQTSW